MSMSVLLDNTTVTAMLSVSILLALLPANVMMGLLVTEQVVKVRIIIHSTLYFLEIKHIDLIIYQMSCNVNKLLAMHSLKMLLKQNQFFKKW